MCSDEPEALCGDISGDIIEIIKHRLDTSALDQANAIVIALGRQIFGARKLTSATFGRALQEFGGRALVDLPALMGNYAGTAALLTAFDCSWIPISHQQSRHRDAVDALLRPSSGIGQTNFLVRACDIV